MNINIDSRQILRQVSCDSDDVLEPSTLEVALGNLALLARDCVCLSGVKVYSFTQLPGGFLAAPHLQDGRTVSTPTPSFDHQ